MNLPLWTVEGLATPSHAAHDTWLRRQVPVEALGLELFLENGITRAGWLVVPGDHLGSASTRAAERVRWTWELWPWPKVFVARAACAWERNQWTDVHGVGLEWYQRPPPPFAFEPTPVGGAPDRRWRVERTVGAQTTVVADLQPISLTRASWRWMLHDVGAVWRTSWRFVAAA